MTDVQDEGYILQVDLEYPEDLHRAHGSFPLAPEKLNISADMLSPYAKGEHCQQIEPNALHLKT